MEENKIRIGKNTLSVIIDGEAVPLWEIAPDVYVACAIGGSTMKLVGDARQVMKIRIAKKGAAPVEKKIIPGPDQKWFWIMDGIPSRPDNPIMDFTLHVRMQTTVRVLVLPIGRFQSLVRALTKYLDMIARG